MFSNADAKLYVGRWYQGDTWFYNRKTGGRQYWTNPGGSGSLLDGRDWMCLDAYQSSEITIQVKYCNASSDFQDRKYFRFSEKENLLIENDHIENVITYRVGKKEIHEYEYGKFQDDGSILWTISDRNAEIGVTWRRSNQGNPGELSF